MPLYPSFHNQEKSQGNSVFKGEKNEIKKNNICMVPIVALFDNSDDFEWKLEQILLV